VLYGWRATGNLEIYYAAGVQHVDELARFLLRWPGPAGHGEP